MATGCPTYLGGVKEPGKESRILWEHALISWTPREAHNTKARAAMCAERPHARQARTVLYDGRHSGARCVYSFPRKGRRVIQTVVRPTINLETVRFLGQATLKTNPDISNQQSAYNIYA